MQDEHDVELYAFLATLVRRRLPVLATFSLILVGTLALSLLVRKTYTTHVQFIAGRSSATDSSAAGNTDLPILNALLDRATQKTAETYAALLSERSVADQVIADLNLHLPPARLLMHVSVKPVTNTSLIELSAEWGDPSTSAAIANDFIKVLVDRQRRLASEGVQSNRNYLVKQRLAARKRVHAAEAALAAYSSAKGIADVDIQAHALIESVSAIDAQLAKTKLDRRDLEARLNIIAQNINSSAAQSTVSSTSVQNPVEAQLELQLAQVNLKLKAARRQYTEQYPEVVELKAQRRALQKQLAATPRSVNSAVDTAVDPTYQQLVSSIPSLRSRLDADNAALSELSVQRARLESALTAFPNQAAKVTQLQLELTSAVGVYNALERKQNDALVMGTTAPSDITTTQYATAADATAKPDLLLNLVVGSLLGLIAAVGSAFLYESLGYGAKTEAELASQLQLTILGSVPTFGRLGRHPLELRSAPGMTGEAFITLATSLQYASGRTLKSITITSPLPGDGKSTIALYTAIAMSELQPRVLLLDADLRRPTLHDRLCLPNTAGLSEVLVGRRLIDDVLQTTRYPGLDFVSSGAAAPTPVKLLKSPNMNQLLRELSRRYACVIVDTPAVNAASDAAVIAGTTEASILIVSSTKTNMPAYLKAIRVFEQFGVTNLLGIVLNRSAELINVSSACYVDDHVEEPPLP